MSGYPKFVFCKLSSRESVDNQKLCNLLCKFIQDLQVWFWYLSIKIFYHDLANNYAMESVEPISVFMTKKSHEQKRDWRKLPNYLLQFKSVFVYQQNKTFLKINFQKLNSRFPVFLLFARQKKLIGITQERRIHLFSVQLFINLILIGMDFLII